MPDSAPMAMPTNISLGQNRLIEETLAYYDTAMTTAIKRLTAKAPTLPLSQLLTCFKIKLFSLASENSSIVVNPLFKLLLLQKLLIKLYIVKLYN
jgi:hypothetical protein